MQVLKLMVLGLAAAVAVCGWAADAREFDRSLEETGPRHKGVFSPMNQREGAADPKPARRLARSSLFADVVRGLEAVGKGSRQLVISGGGGSGSGSGDRRGGNRRSRVPVNKPKRLLSRNLQHENYKKKEGHKFFGSPSLKAAIDKQSCDAAARNAPADQVQAELDKCQKAYLKASGYLLFGRRRRLSHKFTAMLSIQAALNKEKCDAAARNAPADQVQAELSKCLKAYAKASGYSFFRRQRRLDHKFFGSPSLKAAIDKQSCDAAARNAPADQVQAELDKCQKAYLKASGYLLFGRRRRLAESEDPRHLFLSSELTRIIQKDKCEDAARKGPADQVEAEIDKCRKAYLRSSSSFFFPRRNLRAGKTQTGQN